MTIVKTTAGKPIAAALSSYPHQAPAHLPNLFSFAERSQTGRRERFLHPS
ncbi:MAG: hypothetical protein F6K32_05625 [Desertifilum sp. SIO1I2]|nr:hypothetical protein [Desertifilum sp. SIO1I2]